MKILSVTIVLLFYLCVSASDIGLAFLYVCVYYMRMQTHWMYIFCNLDSYVAIIVYSEILPMYYMTKTNSLGN